MNDFIECLRENSKCCRNMYDLCLRLGIEHFGGNTYREIYDIAKENNIQLVFSYEQKEKEANNQQIKIEDILNNKCRYDSSKLKKRLIKEGYKEHICERCQKTEWEGLPIPLELHHINGNHYDNSIENLQLLCPNCHALSNTYCGKNTYKNINNERIIKKYKHQPKDICEKISISREKLVQLLVECTHKEIEKLLKKDFRTIKKWCKKYNIDCTKEGLLKEKNVDICLNCNKIFYKKIKSQKYCSTKCFSVAQRKATIDREMLLDVFKKEGTFQKTGKVFNVSDKCIIKWLKRFGLPSHKKELLAYINNLD